MSYIEKHLMAGEKVVYVTGPHPILLWKPVAICLIGLALGGYVATIKGTYGLMTLGACALISSPAWVRFFTSECGITNKRVATFEHAVRKYGGGQDYVDLFWPGMLLVEQKSRGKSLDRAFAQALDYFPGIKERGRSRCGSSTTR